MLNTIFGNLLTIGLLAIFAYVALKKGSPKILNAVASIVIKKLESRLPKILEEVGLSVGEQISAMITEQFTNPTIKKAYSLAGTLGGQTKTDKALVNRVSDKIIEQYPALRMILDRFGITAAEGLQLVNDPMIGPYIRQAIGSFTEGQKPNKSSESTSNLDVFKIG